MAKANPQTEVVRELLHTYNEAMASFSASPGDLGRVKSIRPSQLPFCPVQFFIQHATFGATRVLDMRGAFYTSIGTAVHEVAQNYLAPSGKFLAAWECKSCGKKKMGMQHICCDQQMRYHEVEIDHRGVVGHIDGIFRDKKGRYWILDFKTTSVTSARKKLKEPGVSYVEQVEAYALLLFMQYGIRVEGVILMFIKRDNPKTPVVWTASLKDADFKVIKARIAGYKRQHREALNVQTKEEALALLRFGKCANPWCKTCRSARSTKTLILEAFKRGAAAKRLPLIGL